MRSQLLTIAILLLPAGASALEIFACEPEWASLVNELAGEDANVTVATTAFQDPHRLQAKPSLIAAIRKADLVEHLAKIGCRGGMHQCGVPFQAHGFYHSQCCQRIDKAGGAFARCGAFMQGQAHMGIYTAVLGVHCAANKTDSAAQQGLGCI